MASKVVPVAPFDLVVFGGTGDLARRKLLPALYHLMHVGQMPGEARVICVARSELSVGAYRAMAGEAIEAATDPANLDAAALEAFLERVDYVRIDVTSEQGWSDLAAALAGSEGRVRAFYLAVDPAYFTPICDRLKAGGIATPDSRLVVEKPLGRDLDSAQVLEAQLTMAFDERRLYRIDHYLGKETVQNLMALRFANALFEPVWNARHVDHVQITVAESVGVEGRGGYYDRSGALRDMVQNHLLQLLCLIAMEAPAQFDPNSIRDEKLKVLKSLDPITASTIRQYAVRGQYRGYCDEPETGASTTETYVALKVAVANWRWSGTPFYLRTGKKLRARMSEIAVVFKAVPHSIFPAEAGEFRNNALLIRLQPDEGITLSMTIKEPGPGGMRLTEAPLDMSFAQSLGVANLRIPDAYERLLMDVIRGNQTLFMRGDEVEAAWSWVDPILDAWASDDGKPLLYDPGTSGPEDSLMLMHRDGRRWREI